jgi:hypothetical protein
MPPRKAEPKDWRELAPEDDPFPEAPWPESPNGKPAGRLGEQAVDSLDARILHGGTILDEPATPPAVWGQGEDILWAEGESLIIAGPDGTGKTTLAGCLVRGRLGIGDGQVLGHPVSPGKRRVLLLLMDRPRQARRALRRLFTTTSGPAFTRIGGRPGSGGRSRRTAHPACSSTRAAASVATSTRTSPGTCRQRMTITGTSWQGSNCWSGARLEPAHRLLHPNLRVTDLRFPPACWLVPPADEPASDLTLSTTHRQRVNVAVAGALVLVDSPAGHFHVALAQPDLDGSWLATQKICHALSVA